VRVSHLPSRSLRRGAAEQGERGGARSTLPPSTDQPRLEDTAFFWDWETRAWITDGSEEGWHPCVLFQPNGETSRSKLTAAEAEGVQ